MSYSFFVGRPILCPSGQFTIFFCVGGRFLQLNQSFNTSSPSSNSQSSSDLRKTVLMSVVARSIDNWIFLNVGRLTIEGLLVFGAILTNRLRSTVYGLGLTFTGYRLIYKRRSGAEPFSSINWSNAHEVTGEYSAIANLSIESADHRYWSKVRKDHGRRRQYDNMSNVCSGFTIG